MLKNNFYMDRCNSFWVANQPQAWTEQREDISQNRKKEFSLKKKYMSWELYWNMLF